MTYRTKQGTKVEITRQSLPIILIPVIVAIIGAVSTIIASILSKK